MKSETFIRVSLCAGLVAGALEIICALHLLNSQALAREWLYIATDLSILLALVGWSVVLHADYGRVPIAILILLPAFAFIAGPSSDALGISAYQLGTPFIALGLLLLGVSLVKNTVHKLGGSLLIAASVSGVLATAFPVLYQPVAVSNIVLATALFTISTQMLSKVLSKPLSKLTGQTARIVGVKV